MTWAELHVQSEAMAADAAHARRNRDFALAAKLYRLAAEFESQALDLVDAAKPRTLGTTAVSAVALWYKAEAYAEAEQIAYRMLASDSVPEFARVDLRNLVQAIWTESAKREAGVRFAPGEVVVSVKGGDVVTGGAPLDLIVDKVQTIQALFYRTVEFMNGMAHRKRGRPVRDIQDACRPWLFQSVPGSYQFAVAIQSPEQHDMFRNDFAPDDVAERFLEIVDAAGSGNHESLARIVPSEDYRTTFLKLTRGLAPTGAGFDRIELRSPTIGKPVSLDAGSRQTINATIRGQSGPVLSADRGEVELNGILRAVHLDKDWLELIVDGKSVHVDGLEDALDDIIGPLVNRRVVVRVLNTSRGTLKFVDIEGTE